MKKIISSISILSFVILLLIPLQAHAVAVYLDDLTLSADCSEGSPENYFWEVNWNDELPSRADDETFINESFYKLEAPCKVFLGDTFEVRITATDDVCKTGNYKGRLTNRWYLTDTLLSGPPVVTTVDSGSYWTNAINVYPTGVWQKSYMRPTPSADDHDFVFSAIDLGYCGGGHSWTGSVTQGTVVDPVRGAPTNTPPSARVNGDGAVYNLLDRLVLSGTVSDLEGDNLRYMWFVDGSANASGAVSAIEGGNPVRVPLSVLGNGLSLGVHRITLQVSDAQETVTDSIQVEYVDTTAPTLSLSVDTQEIGPPNNKMVPVQVSFIARDNSAVAPTISVSVSNSGGDYVLDSVDEAAGTASLQLKAAKGATYTVTVTAVDGSENSADANVTITVLDDLRDSGKGLKKGHSK